MDDDDDSGKSETGTEESNEGGGYGNPKDELGLLVSAWLFDPAVSESLSQGQIDAALKLAGLSNNIRLRDALQTIDPEQIRRLVEQFRRPDPRPMG